MQDLAEYHISPDFIAASDHDFSCTCDICRRWWLSMGPEEDLAFGPFGETLWPEYAEKLGVTVEEARRWFLEALYG